MTEKNRFESLRVVIALLAVLVILVGCGSGQSTQSDTDSFEYTDEALQNAGNALAAAQVASEQAEAAVAEAELALEFASEQAPDTEESEVGASSSDIADAFSEAGSLSSIARDALAAAETALYQAEETLAAREDPPLDSVEAISEAAQALGENEDSLAGVAHSLTEAGENIATTSDSAHTESTSSLDLTLAQAKATLVQAGLVIAEASAALQASELTAPPVAAALPEEEETESSSETDGSNESPASGVGAAGGSDETPSPEVSQPSSPEITTPPTDASTDGQLVETMPSLGAVRIFPGAEGFGTDSIGGRGGRVCAVTNTNPEGPGSLRECAELDEPRIVVFKVGGTIELDSSIVISHPYISIFGQTAPGDGILVRMSLDSEDTPIKVKSHDVLIQHLRMRAGTSINTTCCRDAAGVSGSGDEVYNVVLDHNSMSWGTDQIAHTWYDVNNVTFSYNIISESLHDNGSNQSGPAGRGLIIGSEGAHSISIHHNFFAHSYQRNPLLKISGVADVVNNLVYHWISRAGQQNSTYSGMQVNWVKNRFIGLTNQSDSSQDTVLGWGDIHLEHEGHSMQAYFEGNIGDRRPSDSLPEWAIAVTHWETPYDPALGYHSDTRFPAPAITELSADDLELRLPSLVGAYLPRRDSVDTRIVNELRSRTGKMPNCVARDDRPESRCENNAGGWPDMQSGEVPADSDNDGMPDDWERRYGLNPQQDDAAGDINGDGYTNIEAWIHSLDNGGVPESRMRQMFNNIRVWMRN